MILYHGGVDIVKALSFSIGRTDVDFGLGFYLTDIKKQAERWAMRKNKQFSRQGILNVFEFSESNSLLIKKFDGYNDEWLDFVILNRCSRNSPLKSDYDIIIGNVADDDVIDAISSYLALVAKGRATKNTRLALMDELSFAKPNNQYAFKTQRALDALKFLKSEEINA